MENSFVNKDEKTKESRARAYRRDPNEELERAILNSDISAIDKALEAGADVNFSLEHFEIKGPHYLVLSYPLWLAIQENVKDMKEVISHLLSRGAKPSNYKTYDLASKGSTLVGAVQLVGKARYGIVKLLLEHGASPDEGRGAVYDHISWALSSREENRKLKDLLNSYSKKKVIGNEVEI
jgi:ankyrin repeat protein